MIDMWSSKPPANTQGSRAICSIPAGFWSDMPWLNVSADRQTIFIEPSFPLGGLLGGAPDTGPKMTKLQALAAARKKKAQDEKLKFQSHAVDETMTGLSLATVSSAPGPDAAEIVPKDRPRTYTSLKRRNIAHQREDPQPTEVAEEQPVARADASMPPPSIELAEPSAFASTMFGSAKLKHFYPQSMSLFTLPYLIRRYRQSTDGFAGPSPDDIVIAAQSKGSAHSANDRK